MTAAERQRKRRAKLREGQEPKRRGRPALQYVPDDTGYALFMRLMEQYGPSVRRHDINNTFASLGKQVLGIEKRTRDYAPENVQRYKSLAKKTILEQVGRHAMWLAHQGAESECVRQETLGLVDEILREHPKPNVKDTVAFFQWIRG
jgi:hypothetical protein